MLINLYIFLGISFYSCGLTAGTSSRHVSVCLSVCVTGRAPIFLQPYLTIPYFLAFLVGGILAVTTFMGQANLRNGRLIR